MRLAGELVVLCILLLSGQQSLAVAADLPRPTATYEERTRSGLPVRLDFYPRETGPFLAFRLAQAPSSARPAPTLEEEGTILDRLLGRLMAGHADLPRSFKFAPDTQALVDALDQRLLDARANWDIRRGAPRHGRVSDVLTAELARILATSSIEAAFETHGYGLKLDGISRIEMGAVPDHNGARLPVFIPEMDIMAMRKEAGHG